MAVPFGPRLHELQPSNHAVQFLGGVYASTGNTGPFSSDVQVPEWMKLADSRSIMQAFEYV
ncbi:MAG: hypothetical protein AAB472_01055 [Patescibacteria group bacterium]